MEVEPRAEAGYIQIIKRIFERYHKPGSTGFTFSRRELAEAASELGISAPKNLGDVVYSFRFRRPLPESIRQTAPDGLHWIIRLAGTATYRFAAVAAPIFEPSVGRAVVKIPDSTPAIIAEYALSDEQALLAILRYNRLIDIFLRATCYSLQNHLRTQIVDVGQIEVDELYLGVDRSGTQFVIPVQAKGKGDKLGVVQVEQDMAFCRSKFPHLICRSVGAQFKRDTVVLMEFAEIEGEIVVVNEAHYRLVKTRSISPAELESYARSLEA